MDYQVLAGSVLGLSIIAGIVVTQFVTHFQPKSMRCSKCGQRVARQ